MGICGRCRRGPAGVSWVCAPGNGSNAGAFAGSSGGAGGLPVPLPARRRHGTVLKSGRSSSLSAFFGGVSGGSRWRRRSKLPPPLPLLAVVGCYCIWAAGFVLRTRVATACRAFKGTAWAARRRCSAFRAVCGLILRLPLTWAWLWLLSWPALLAGKGGCAARRCCFPRVRAAPRRRPYRRFLSVCRRFGFGDWGARVLQYSLT